MSHQLSRTVGGLGKPLRAFGFGARVDPRIGVMIGPWVFLRLESSNCGLAFATMSKRNRYAVDGIMQSIHYSLPSLVIVLCVSCLCRGCFSSSIVLDLLVSVAVSHVCTSQGSSASHSRGS
jgi:hypothetical protein